MWCVCVCVYLVCVYVCVLCKGVYGALSNGGGVNQSGLGVGVGSLDPYANQVGGAIGGGQYQGAQSLYSTGAIGGAMNGQKQDGMCFDFQNKGFCKYYQDNGYCKYSHVNPQGQGGGFGMLGAFAQNTYQNAMGGGFQNAMAMGGAMGMGGGFQKPCFEFQNQGTCKYGAACRYKHAGGTSVYGAAQGGQGLRKPCFEFHNQGTCKYGAQCRFSHEQQTGQQQQALRIQKPCFEFQRNNGVCKFGDACKFSHDLNNGSGDLKSQEAKDSSNPAVDGASGSEANNKRNFGDNNPTDGAYKRARVGDSGETNGAEQGMVQQQA